MTKQVCNFFHASQIELFSVDPQDIAQTLWLAEFLLCWRTNLCSLLKQALSGNIRAHLNTSYIPRAETANPHTNTFQ